MSFRAEFAPHLELTEHEQSLALPRLIGPPAPAEGRRLAFEAWIARLARRAIHSRFERLRPVHQIFGPSMSVAFSPWLENRTPRRNDRVPPSVVQGTRRILFHLEQAELTRKSKFAKSFGLTLKERNHFSLCSSHSPLFSSSPETGPLLRPRPIATLHISRENSDALSSYLPVVARSPFTVGS